MSDLPEGWVNTSLGSLVNMKYGKALKKSFRQGSAYPVYGSNGIVGEHCEALTNGPAIIIGRKGSIGEVHLSEGSCWPIDTTYYIDDLGKQSIKYWYYYLKSLSLAYLNKATAIPGINRADAYKLEVVLPPLNEQNLIAEKLDHIFDKIRSVEAHIDKICATLKNFRNSILAYASSGQLTQDWRDKREITLDSWQNKSGADVFPFITSGSRGWAKYYSEKGSIFLRVGNLDHQTIDLNLGSLKHVMLPRGVEGKRTRIKLGDILISITADVGMVALISNDIGEAYINQHLCLARQSGEYNGRYLGYYLASPIGGLVQLTNMQRGAIKPGLTLGDIRKLSIKIPSLEEQQEIVSRVEYLLGLAHQIENKINHAKKIVNKVSQSVLAKAFRGGLVPQDPNDEPALKLLEAIHHERKFREQLDKSKQRSEVKKPRKEITMSLLPEIDKLDLVAILKEKSPLTPNELFELSQYEVETIEDFYQSLKKGVEGNQIYEERSKDDQVLLKAKAS